jgi:methylated-DNA-[protein]-cysteine S-methyltransferase
MNGISSLEQALRRGPGHARETDAGESTPGERRAALQAARRFAERAGAQGLADVSYARADSPFGPLLLASSERGLVRLAFPEEDEEQVLGRLSQRLSPRIVEAPGRLDRARRELEQYFAGSRRSFELSLDWALVGPFGRRVLGVAAQIPYGGSLTYAQVAAQAGSPRASRAAGNALGANPVPIVVPCHRVLRGSGALGGYAGGLERKRFLLELESALDG